MNILAHCDEERYKRQGLGYGGRVVGVVLVDDLELLTKLALTADDAEKRINVGEKRYSIGIFPNSLRAYPEAC